MVAPKREKLGNPFKARKEKAAKRKSNRKGKIEKRQKVRKKGQDLELGWIKWGVLIIAALLVFSVAFG